MTTIQFVHGQVKKGILLPKKLQVNRFETQIKHVFGIPNTSLLLGFFEESKGEEETFIPIEVLEEEYVFDSTGVYRISLMETEQAQQPQQNYNSTDLTTQQTHATNQNYNYNYSTTGYAYPDPWQNDEYFYQYGKLTIHGEMLKDEARTVGYREAFRAHAADFKDKVVLDLGCGTGILSFFAAEVGAKYVYAVEASSLAEWTELVVASNGLSGRIKVLRGRIEELHLPEKVDIIVSEWMGTFLIFESMLESLLFARDHWLKPDGKLFPSHSSIYLSPVTIPDYWNPKVDFWASKPYNVDMSVLIPFAKKCAFEKPIIDQPVKGENLFCDALELKFFDLKTVPINEPYDKTTIGFNFKANKTSTMHGYVAWFDVFFRGTGPEVVLSTKPGLKDTHWHQLLLLFDEPVEVKEGEVIKGTIRYQRNPDLLRHLIFDLSFSVEGNVKSYSKKFYLWGTE